MMGFCNIAEKEKIKIDIASATGYFDMVANPNREFAFLKYNEKRRNCNDRSS